MMAAAKNGEAGAGVAPAPAPLVWTPHPILKVPSERTRNALLRQPDGVAKLSEYFVAREMLIKRSEEDPFNFGTEPHHWRDADKLLELLWLLILMIFGGNRAGKSEYAAKRMVQDAMANPDSVMFAMHENEKASIGLQQKYIWKYLPPEIRALNGKKDPVYKVNYTQANGFTDGKLVFPNRTEIYFLTYHQKPSDFEGLELGAKAAPAKIAVWADENLTLPWLNMLKLRCVSRSGKIVWTYTPVKGITPPIKELLGSTMKVLESRESELLPGRVNVNGCPEGHMPYIVAPAFEKSRAIYFFSIFNPFGGHYENIRSLCQGKGSEYIERRAYGWSRDTVERRFPYFGSWNVIRREDLPETGTNYMFTDPAGGRNWATIWLRVAPGNPPKFYVYRDWPNEQRYGEWALPTEREITGDSKRGWDGDPGPAQQSLGYGIVQYKQLFLREESFQAHVVKGRIIERDPYRRRLVEEAARADGLTVTLSGEVAEQGGGHQSTQSHASPVLTLEGELVTTPHTWSATLQEKIQGRYIDSRAGRNAQIADKGGTCLVDELARTQFKAGTTEVAGEPMRFRLASGVDIEEGITAINDLLFFNRDEPLMPLINEPLAYVTDDCKQVIWAMSNYTGLGGEDGACKDFVDLWRYFALARLRYLSGDMLATVGGGTY